MYGMNKPILGSQIDRTHPLAKGLVCAILFNEGAGPIFSDIAGNYHSGIIGDGCAWSPLGRTGQVLSFATSFATLIDSKKLSMIGSDATWAAWINQNTITSYRGVIGNSFGSGWWFSTSAGKIAIWIAGIATVYTSATAMVANRWYHIALTFCSSTKKLSFYLDGKPDGTDTSATVIGDGGTTFYLGKDGRGNSNYWFLGMMGSVWAWNRVLSWAELSNHYYNTYGMILDQQTGWLQPGIMGSAAPPVAGGLETSMFFML